MSKRDNEEEDEGMSTFAVGGIAATIGVAIGAGLAYWLGSSSTESPHCNAPPPRSSASTRNTTSERFRNRPAACESCSICFEELDMVVLPCSHRYHRKCVETWIRMKGNCPTCRHPVTLGQLRQL